MYKEILIIEFGLANMQNKIVNLIEKDFEVSLHFYFHYCHGQNHLDLGNFTSFDLLLINIIF